jgi:hypothetical protein
MRLLTDFAKGIIIGVMTSLILFGVIFSIWFFPSREKELIEYAEMQEEIETLREDGFLWNLSSRDPYVFLNDIPGVRGAANNAYAEFERNRDEILQQFRDGLTNR